MPLEIREIGIRFAVGDEEEPSEERVGGDCGGPPRLTARERQTIVDQCVRSVLETLRRERER
jgi:hypothetical protein